MVEFGVLGLAAEVIAALVGSAASYGVARYLMHIEWVFLPGTLAGTLMAALAMMLTFGYAGKCDRAAGQGGSDAAERVKATEPLSKPLDSNQVTELSLRLSLNRTGHSPNWWPTGIPPER